jgi:hypothetical protein
MSLASFVKAAWSVIEPGQPYVHGWHIDFICAHLEAITDGDLNDDGTFYNRLLVNVPPGTMKSLLIGVFWPAWEWGPRNMPNMRYVCASHSLELAIRDSLRMRRLVTDEWYQSHWGDRVTITGDQNAKAKFETTATGSRQACAFTGITGYRGDRVIIDDPHSVDDANSDAKRESVTTLFKEANVHIMALTVLDTTDSAIVRVVVDDPDKARELMINNDFPYTECDVLAVEISDESDLKQVLAALLEAEINIHYVYSFIKRPEGRAALAINAEDTDVAAQTLNHRGFRVLTQRDISR